MRVVHSASAEPGAALSLGPLQPAVELGQVQWAKLLYLYRTKAWPNMERDQFSISLIGLRRDLRWRI